MLEHIQYKNEVELVEVIVKSKMTGRLNSLAKRLQAICSHIDLYIAFRHIQLKKEVTMKEFFFKFSQDRGAKNFGQQR